MNWSERIKSRLGAGGGRNGGQAGGATAAERRRLTRYSLSEGVSCPLGDLVDLSIGGMRVLSPSKPLAQMGQRMMLTIETAGKTLSTPGEVVRLDRKGLKSFEIGIRFLNPTDDISKALDSLAKFGFIGDTSLKCDAAPYGAGGGSAGGSASNGSGQQKQNKSRPRVKITMPDPYKTLDVSRQADHDQIHKAYRTMARQHHPDLNPGPEAAEAFRAITEAYRVLGNQELRAAYDRLVPDEAF